MSKVQLQGNASGTGIFTIASPNSNTDRTLTLPDNTGTLLTSGSAIQKSQLPAGSILQVLQTTKGDYQVATSNGGSWVDITGFSVSITPSSTSSRVMVFARVQMHSDGNMFLRLMRGSTAIAIGDVDGARAQASAGDGYSPDDNRNQNYSINFVDSPSTTSATTYKVQFILENAGKTGVINGQVGNSNTFSRPRYMSTLIVMEIAG
jgi:hypothetical protein